MLIRTYAQRAVDLGHLQAAQQERIRKEQKQAERNLAAFQNRHQQLEMLFRELAHGAREKRFADGKVTVPFQRYLGYDRGPDGNLVVNPEQAVIVKRIYSMFLQGMSYHGIARTLTSDGIPAPGGKENGAFPRYAAS